MSNYTACFRRFHSKRAAAGLQPAATFRKEELALIESFERLRLRTGSVHAVIDAPSGRFDHVLQAYIAYIQHLSHRDAIIVAPKKFQIPLRAITATPRSYLRILGTRRLIGQILLLGAESYCPSLPLCRSRLDDIIQIALPYVCGPNSVVIIQGTTLSQKNTRFRHWAKIAADPASIYHLTPSLGAEAKPKSRPLVVEWRPSHGRIHMKGTSPIPNSQFLIPNSKAFAA